MNLLQDQLCSELAETFQQQPDLPEETLEATVKALWHAAAGHPVSAEQAVRRPLPALNDETTRHLHRLVQRRRSGTPLAYITGRQSFMGLEMLAGPEALIPRKETELLGREAVRLAKYLAGAATRVEIADVCTGAGNVALAVASEVPAARVHAADISEPALSLARRNAEHLGLESRVQFLCGDLLAPLSSSDLSGTIDLVTCNPPYISAAKLAHMDNETSAHEPRLAFDGGAFGVSILMRLLQEAPKVLRPGGWLAFEVGAGQGPMVMKRMEAARVFHDIKPTSDAQGVLRVLAAQVR